MGKLSISTGYHAIEFLLCGQDLNASGPGNRPYTDYDSGPDGTAANQARRGQYLKAAAELLVENLEDMVNQWKPNANNYCNDFVTAPSDESIAKILLGLGSLTGGELAGERMLVAYDSKLQGRRAFVLQRQYS